MGKKLWVVGQYKKLTSKGVVWHFQGVFDSEKKAIEACEDENYFIGPINLNLILPKGGEVWPGCYYPKARVACAACSEKRKKGYNGGCARCHATGEIIIQLPFTWKLRKLNGPRI